MEDLDGKPTQNWLDKVLNTELRINREILLYLVLIVLAILTRFIGLEERVMSHDETTHVYFSWLLEQGRGYSHDPLSHGPLQFHLVALSYFLFGDTDATARFPVALFGVIAVGLVWVFRRWIGRTGALVAAVLMLISPFMLYYSRYVRNEMLVVPQVMATVWALSRYMETRKSRWLYLLALALSLHFVTKETSFIFTAQVLLFLGAYLSWQLITHQWERRNHYLAFLGGLASFCIGMGAALLTFLKDLGADAAVASAVEESLEASATVLAGTYPSTTIVVGGLLALAGLILMVPALILEFGPRLRTDFPALDLLIVVGTTTLPQLGSIPARMLGWDPLAYQDPNTFNRMAAIVIALVAISILIGLLWDWRRWLIVAGIYFIPFIVLYTTIFTNGQGIATGLVGSLGYWLKQQGVERGSQPKYYYALVQIPIYEFLPAIGVFIAGIFGLRSISFKRKEVEAEDIERNSATQETKPYAFPMIPFIVFWVLYSFFGYPLFGERMPWLTVHIALPMILLAGWGIGKFLDSIDWQLVRQSRGWILVGLIFLLMVSTLRLFGSLLGSDQPFQGTELTQLSDTTVFITALLVAIATTIGIARLSREWTIAGLYKILGVLILGTLALLTARAAFRAAFINYDDPTEFLVYAHSARGPKTALEQIEEISIRTTGRLDINVAYDNETTYPFWWYLRNYKNAHFYGSSPNRDLLNSPIVLAGEPNFSTIDSFLSERYYAFEYKRIWWPMQDYYNLTWERLKEMFTSAEYRAALWDIWLNRDYSAYGEVTGRDYSLENWSPSNRMKLYIRKDVAALIWDYGVSPAIIEAEAYTDPFVNELETLMADLIVGQTGTAPGQFSDPRGLAVAPDGTIYVADTKNHRIQHINQDGEVITTWGGFSGVEAGEAPSGTFNEPWGIAVAPDGTVYVADTWNHRIQHFTSDGEFMGMFGYFGQAETPQAFWGPREVEIDSKGRIFVADTGNKRVVVFDANEQVLGEFGGFGLDLGMLDEPVGLGVDDQGRVYVADTWNQRIQVFEEIDEGTFTAVTEWSSGGWLGQALDNKPYIAVTADGTVCTTDPGRYRVLCFSASGEFVLGWGEYGTDTWQFGLPVGIDFDEACNVWVTDSFNGRIMYFDLDLCED
jgi:uncharacterized protein (TIGR03663 family)